MQEFQRACFTMQTSRHRWQRIGRIVRRDECIAIRFRLRRGLQARGLLVLANVNTSRRGDPRDLLVYLPDVGQIAGADRVDDDLKLATEFACLAAATFILTSDNGQMGRINLDMIEEELKNE